MENWNDVKRRAIYIGDARCDCCPVFELNPDTGIYSMIVAGDEDEYQYPKEVVESDDDYIIVEVDGEYFKRIK